MRKYKLNKDFKQQLPSEDETAKYKDFAQLTHAYDQVTKRRKKPLYKDPKAFIALVLILIIVWLVVDAVQEEDERKDQNSTEQTDISAKDDTQNH